MSDEKIMIDVLHLKKKKKNHILNEIIKLFKTKFQCNISPFLMKLPLDFQTLKIVEL